VKVFIVLTGGYGNIGDALIRRVALSWVRGLGEVHAFVGSAPERWLEQLGVEEGDTVYSAARQGDWLRAMLAAGSDAALVWEPGEVSLDRGSIPRELRFLAMTVLARLRGVTIVRLPRSVRRPGRVAAAIHRAACRLSAIVLWRDTASRGVMRVGDTVPDIGFAEAEHAVETAEAFPERRRLTVSIRGTRPEPAAAWFEGIRAAAAELGLEIAVLAQVREDIERAELVAARLGGEHLAWGERSDLDHEAFVRSVYRESALVVSDRLHVLVLALTEGAAVAEIVPEPARKIAQHLAVAGLDGVSFDASEMNASAIAAAAVAQTARRLELVSQAQTAARRLGAVRRRVRECLQRVGAPRVLLSMPGPDGTTRFVDQLSRHARVRYRYFSWPTALLGRYDVFHVHWPEFLVRGRGGALRRALAGALLRRLRRRRIPVVRTVHNARPHAAGGPAEERFLERVDEQTALAIALNPVTPTPPGVPVDLILHGDYLEPFGTLAHSAPVPGRLLAFGRIEPYKGIGELVRVYRAMTAVDASAPAEASGPTPNWTLRIVGSPTQGMREELTQFFESSETISGILRFVDDATLVEEVTAASCVILPYLAMDNSGAILVALSLGRQVIVPRTGVNEWLAEQVGPGWVVMYDGQLTAELLAELLERLPAPPAVRPDLSGRDWETVAERHLQAYRVALGRG